MINHEMIRQMINQEMILIQQDRYNNITHTVETFLLIILVIILVAIFVLIILMNVNTHKADIKCKKKGDKSGLKYMEVEMNKQLNNVGVNNTDVIVMVNSDYNISIGEAYCLSPDVPDDKVQWFCNKLGSDVKLKLDNMENNSVIIGSQKCIKVIKGNSRLYALV